MNSNIFKNQLNFNELLLNIVQNYHIILANFSKYLEIFMNSNQNLLNSVNCNEFLQTIH